MHSSFDEANGCGRKKVNTTLIQTDKLGDVSGHLEKQNSHTPILSLCFLRSLLLSTIPILVLSLLVLVVTSVFNLGSVTYAVISTIGIMVYQSIFCMGFGVIPNIMCSEIFPTKVRGLCITICALTYWAGNITVTYSLPVLLNSIGIAGLLSIYALWCIVSWIFVFLKVPETKGMPLEVISELFAVGAKQASSDNE